MKHQPIKSCQRKECSSKLAISQSLKAVNFSKDSLTWSFKEVMHVAFLLLLKCLKIFPHNCLFLQMLYFPYKNFLLCCLFPHVFNNLFSTCMQVNNGKDLKTKMTALNLSEELPTDKSSDHVLLAMVHRDCYSRGKELLTDGAECLFHE